MKKPNRLKDFIKEQMEFDRDNDHPIVFQYDSIRKLETENRVLRICQQRYISRIERDLGFSLNDDDATEKLKMISDTIKIPDILYQLAA